MFFRKADAKFATTAQSRFSGLLKRFLCAADHMLPELFSFRLPAKY
jgi:hypothetical protein